MHCTWHRNARTPRPGAEGRTGGRLGGRKGQYAATRGRRRRARGGFAAGMGPQSGTDRDAAYSGPRLGSGGRARSLSAPLASVRRAPPYARHNCMSRCSGRHGLPSDPLQVPLPPRLPAAPLLLLLPLLTCCASRRPRPLARMRPRAARPPSPRRRPAIGRTPQPSTVGAHERC